MNKEVLKKFQPLGFKTQKLFVEFVKFFSEENEEDLSEEPTLTTQDKTRHAFHTRRSWKNPMAPPQEL